jgi:hypothetical protein
VWGWVRGWVGGLSGDMGDGETWRRVMEDGSLIYEF